MIIWFLLTVNGGQIDEWEAETRPLVGEEIDASIFDENGDLRSYAEFRVVRVGHELNYGALRGDVLYQHRLGVVVEPTNDEAHRLCRAADAEE